MTETRRFVCSECGCFLSSGGPHSPDCSEAVLGPLDQITDVVLKYHPKPKSKSAKKRKRKERKIAENSR